jgi:UDP-N-acetyl-D-glucosamine dehydrogenase
MPPNAPALQAALLERIRARHARIGILGLGYVGLPLARTFAARGFPVLGFDIDPAKIEKLHRGESYIGHIPGTVIAALQEQGFEATDQFERLDEPDAILICVPTPLTDTRDPDLSHVIASAEAIGRRLRAGQLVVLESTTYPGTTRQVVQPILEQRGLQAGRDFFLAFSPEREDPGNPIYSAPSIPKVVGGLEPLSQEAAAALYSQVVVRVVPVSSLEVAEACKLLENTYRAVNIALVNELKVVYELMGLDVWEVIEAARTKPFGFQAFLPGPGLGGHCIPIDPFYLSWVARKHGAAAHLVELAGVINAGMPEHVIGRVTDALNHVGKAVSRSRILLLGMAYKKDVDDPRESPGFELLNQLLRQGATVVYHDPHIPTLPPTRHQPHLHMESVHLVPHVLHEQDCVLIVTDHSTYDWDWIVEHSRLVVDTRNATRNVSRHRERIVKA